MTMIDYYKMTLKECKELTELVKAEGEVIGSEFDTERLTRNNLIKYNSNIFSVSSYHGIVDIR